MKETFEEGEPMFNGCTKPTMISNLNTKSVSPPLLVSNGIKTSYCQENPYRSSSNKGIVAQCLVTGGILLVAASCGMPIGYSAVLLPQLRDGNSTLPISEELGSWIASVHSAATPVGALLSGVLMDRCGRRLALQLSVIPVAVGWILIATANSHALILIGRIIAGVAVGSTAAPAQVLIGEIAEPHIRGILGSGPMISYSLGILLVYALGSLVDWRTVAGLSTILPLTALVAFLFLPESPVWLVRQGLIAEAHKSMNWLRGGTIQGEKELQQIISRVREEEAQKQQFARRGSVVDTAQTCVNTLFKPEIMKPFLIINIFNLLQIFSGTYLIVFYAVDILSQINGNYIDHFLAAVITALVRLIFATVSAILSTSVGRRKLGVGSGLGSAIPALILGTFLYFRDFNESSQLDLYITGICVLIYVAANTTGLMVLPGLMLSELLPASRRGLVGGISFSVLNFTLFVAAKMFPFIKTALGIHGVFWLFGTSSLLAAIFLYIMLPETKERTLNEIEDYFLKDNLMWITRKNCEKNNKEQNSV